MAARDVTKERKGAFVAELANAEPGDEILYHIGEHCAGPHKQDALNAWEGGQCFIFQRKLAPMRFAYFARKTKKPMP